MDDEENLSTDSSDFEENDVTESTPDGLKLKKKLCALLKRVKRSRKLSTRIEEEPITESNSFHAQEGGNISADDKFDHVFQRDTSFDIDYTETCSYTLSKRKRGMAVFIINSEFSHQPHRPFTKMDARFMTGLFRHLGFEIKLLENRKGHQLWKELIEIQRSITTDYDCFVCVISSHGAEFPLSRWLDPDRKLRQHVIFTTDGEIPTDRILEIFSDDRCKNLIGKPRMFFIQACRCVMGADDEFDIDKGIDVEVVNTTVHDQQYPVLYVRRYKSRFDGVENDTHIYNNSEIGGSKVGYQELDQDTRGRISDSRLDPSLPDTSGRPEDSNTPYNHKREMYFRSKDPSSFCFIPCYEDFLVMFSSASGTARLDSIVQQSLDKTKKGATIRFLNNILKQNHFNTNLSVTTSSYGN